MTHYNWVAGPVCSSLCIICKLVAAGPFGNPECAEHWVSTMLMLRTPRCIRHAILLDCSLLQDEVHHMEMYHHLPSRNHSRGASLLPMSQGYTHEKYVMPALLSTTLHAYHACIMPWRNLPEVAVNLQQH